MSLRNGTKPYNDTSYCAIELPGAFLTAETFEINECFPNFDTRWVFAKYPGGDEKFNKELNEKLILNQPSNIKGTLKVQTTIDSNGKMTNFKPLSNLGFENELIKVLENMRNWKPTKVSGKSVSQIKVIEFTIQ